jgi:hypothetical protein
MKPNCMLLKLTDFDRMRGELLRLGTKAGNRIRHDATIPCSGVNGAACATENGKDGRGSTSAGRWDAGRMALIRWPLLA